MFPVLNLDCRIFLIVNINEKLQAPSTFSQLILKPSFILIKRFNLPGKFGSYSVER